MKTVRGFAQHEPSVLVSVVVSLKNFISPGSLHGSVFLNPTPPFGSVATMMLKSMMAIDGEVVLVTGKRARSVSFCLRISSLK